MKLALRIVAEALMILAIIAIIWATWMPSLTAERLEREAEQQRDDS